MFIDVLIELKNKQTDQTYTYEVPKPLQEKVAIGKRVKVSFNNRSLEGFILNIKKTQPENMKILPIKEVVDEEVVLNEELIEIGKYIKKECLCTLSSAYATMLPKALKASDKTKINKKFQVYLELEKTYEETIPLCTNDKQKEIVAFVAGTANCLKKEANLISSSSVNTLLKKGMLKEVQEEMYRLKEMNVVSDVKKELNYEQKKVFNAITSKLDQFKKFLLWGVTGSGKTEIYMQVIERVLKKGKTAIVLVPEISLTPQFVFQFKSRFKNIVAVLHSGLSDGERYDEWRKITRSEVKIVIGARSAIFASLKNLGIIIVDEEHSESYKQENNPRYNAIDVAEFRAEYNKIPIVLGSATPTLERMAKASKNLYELLPLKHRVNEKPLPTCTIVDMAPEIKKGNAFLSERLKVEIESAISRNEQIILLLNRRGYATTITCSSCGFTYKCPNCDITLTYHKTKNNLRCHYCGYTIFKNDKCPKCQTDLNFYGYGTEKVEAYLKEEFDDIRVLRMDTDTTRGKNSYEKMIEEFKNQKYDILLGTQMISKGLDFPNVSVVGIINADTTLNIPDFRSGERTFDLLYQAAGRAGRGNTLGNVIIQTFNKDNFILKCVAEQDYEKFYQYEMNIRKKLKYSPYYYLVSLKVTSKDYELCGHEAKKVANYLKKHLSSESIILGPTTSNVFKVNNIYRFQIIIKYRFDKSLTSTLEDLDKLFRINNKVNLEIDKNPVKI